MWLMLLVLQFVPQDSLRGTVDIKIKEVLPPQDSYYVEDSKQNYLKVPEKIVELRPSIGKVPELKEKEIPISDILLYEANLTQYKRGQKAVKEAVRAKACDREIMLIKLNTEKNMLMGALEMAKVQGKDDEVQKIESRIKRVDSFIENIKEEER